MPTLQKLPAFAKAVLRGVHNFESHTFKAALTNAAPAATAAVLADVAQISGGAYPAGGYALDGVTLADASGGAKVVIADEVITAAGGAVGPLRFAVVFNDTTAGKPLVGYVDYGSSITLADGETLTLDFDPDTGILTLT